MDFSQSFCTIWRTLRFISRARSTRIASPRVISRIYWLPTERNFFLLAAKRSDDSKYDDRRYLSSYCLVAAIGLAFCSNNDRDNNEEFLLAAKNSNIASLKRGLSNGVDVNCRHQLGWTALHVSVINGNKKAVEWLIKVGGANVNTQDEYSSARRMARVLKASHHQIAQLREHHFCSFINPYATYTGFTPLHYAVITDNEDIIQLLLDNGANPSIEDSMGRTPINYCTNESVRKLLEKYSVKFEENELRKRLEERRKYPLEDRLRNHLVGQEGAITTVASAIRRRELGWNDTDHPLVFLFLGSSGIGK
uniref:Uncharacterized protein n=1 Tax=Amphimedon queenslandica TaxID=400682 RepID=A0A1X7TKR5_AMPQE